MCAAVGRAHREARPEGHLCDQQADAQQADLAVVTSQVRVVPNHLQLPVYVPEILGARICC